MWLLPICLAISVFLLFNLDHKGTTPRTFTYTRFVKEVTNNKVSTASITSAGASTSVVVMAATYRAEILDTALLRPGRFDRTVEIPLPNQRERTAILAIHGQKKQLGPDVDLGAVSRGTPGFSGADLANLVNEAAINAVRDHREVLSAGDFSAARDRLLIGSRDASNALLPEEKTLRRRPRSGPCPRRRPF
jgi:cell division protease FtsH